MCLVITCPSTLTPLVSSECPILFLEIKSQDLNQMQNVICIKMWNWLDFIFFMFVFWSAGRQCSRAFVQNCYRRQLNRQFVFVRVWIWRICEGGWMEESGGWGYILAVHLSQSHVHWEIYGQTMGFWDVVQAWAEPGLQNRPALGLFVCLFVCSFVLLITVCIPPFLGSCTVTVSYRRQLCKMSLSFVTVCGSSNCNRCSFLCHGALGFITFDHF